MELVLTEEELSEINARNRNDNENEGDVDWELTLSLETTLQLLDEEINPEIHTQEELIQRILDVCRGRGDLPNHLRAKVWQILLGQYKSSNQRKLSDVYDLKDQLELREQCSEFVQKTCEESSSVIQSRLESVLTSYYKERGILYSSAEASGHLDLLKPFLAFNLSDTELYNLFWSIVTNLVPRDVHNQHGLPFHIFRLLLLYHEPELCSLLDSLRIIPYSYAAKWLVSLLSGSISSVQSVLVLWDVYLQYRDPFLIYHMALVLLLNAKDHLSECKKSGTEKSQIINFLSELPSSLAPSDIPDFLTISQHYASQTPNSYRRMFESALYGNESYLTFNNNSTSPCRRVAMQSLCLPISGEELLNSIRMAKSESASANSDTSSTDSFFVRFFVVDCRPAEQYNSGHLPTAFHLDCALMLLEPLKFSTAVQGLLLAQKESLNVGSAAGGEHLCFVGSGREEEDMHVHMVVSSFLQRNTPKVGLLSGGYQSLHELLSSSVDFALSDHNNSTCPECLLNHGTTPPPPTQPTTSTSTKLTSKLNQFSLSLKSKSAEMRGKLIEYMNPETGHVKSSDKEKSKPYRNLLPVFMIEDDGGGNSTEIQPGGVVENVKAFLKGKISYSCSEVLSDGSHFEGWVIINKENIMFLRDAGGDRGEISLSRLLTSVIKITSKKKHPELITFKYGHVLRGEGGAAKNEGEIGGESRGEGEGAMQGDVAEITHSDRFYLPSGAKEFVQTVKKFIDC